MSPSSLRPTSPHCPHVPWTELDHGLLTRPPTYTVRHLLDVCPLGQIVEYLVDREEYGPEEWSWVLRRDLLEPPIECVPQNSSHTPWSQLHACTKTLSPDSFFIHGQCTHTLFNHAHSSSVFWITLGLPFVDYSYS